MSPDKTQEFRVLIRAIADHLAEWDCQPADETGRDDVSRICHADGRRLHISLQDKERLAITGGWPRHGDQVIGPYDLRSEAPRITVAIARGAEAIARAIEKRFLPEYTPLWERAKALIVQNEEYDRRLAALQARICEALGETTPREHYSLYFSKGWATVEVSSPDSISINLHSLPVDMALAIIATVKAAEARLRSTEAA